MAESSHKGFNSIATCSRPMGRALHPALSFLAVKQPCVPTNKPVISFDEDSRLIEAHESQTVCEAKVAKARKFFPPVRVGAFKLLRRFLR